MSSLRSEDATAASPQIGSKIGWVRKPISGSCTVPTKKNHHGAGSSPVNVAASGSAEPAVAASVPLSFSLPTTLSKSNPPSPRKSHLTSPRRAVSPNPSTAHAHNTVTTSTSQISPSRALSPTRGRPPATHGMTTQTTIPSPPDRPTPIPPAYSPSSLDTNNFQMYTVPQTTIASPPGSIEVQKRPKPNRPKPPRNPMPPSQKLNERIGSAKMQSKELNSLELSGSRPAFVKTTAPSSPAPRALLSSNRLNQSVGMKSSGSILPLDSKESDPNDYLSIREDTDVMVEHEIELEEGLMSPTDPTTPRNSDLEDFEQRYSASFDSIQYSSASNIEISQGAELRSPIEEQKDQKTINLGALDSQQSESTPIENQPATGNEEMHYEPWSNYSDKLPSQSSFDESKNEKIESEQNPQTPVAFSPFLPTLPETSSYSPNIGSAKGPISPPIEPLSPQLPLVAKHPKVRSGLSSSSNSCAIGNRFKSKLNQSTAPHSTGSPSIPSLRTRSSQNTAAPPPSSERKAPVPHSWQQLSQSMQCAPQGETSVTKLSLTQSQQMRERKMIERRQYSSQGSSKDQLKKLPESKVSKTDSHIFGEVNLRRSEISGLNDRRTLVVKEILSSEKVYLQNLHDMIHCYRDPLRKAGVIAEEDMKVLFLNVEVLEVFHKQLYDCLEQRIKEWSPTQRIADVFLKLMPFMKLYTEYVNSFQTAIARFEKLLAENPKLMKSLKGLSAGNLVGYLGFQSLRIAPIQRMPRYVLLLNELRKHTPEEHPDYDNVKLATERFTEVSNFINETKRQVENSERLSSFNLNPRKGKIHDLRISTQEAPHTFHPKTLAMPTWCDMCADFIYGVVLQAYKCKKCGMIVDTKCFENKVPNHCIQTKKPTLVATNRKYIMEGRGSYKHVKVLDSPNDVEPREVLVILCSDCVTFVEESSQIDTFQLCGLVKWISSTTNRTVVVADDAEAPNVAISITCPREQDLHLFTFRSKAQKEEWLDAIFSTISNYFREHPITLTQRGIMPSTKIRKQRFRNRKVDSPRKVGQKQLASVQSQPDLKSTSVVEFRLSKTVSDPKLISSETQQVLQAGASTSPSTGVSSAESPTVRLRPAPAFPKKTNNPSVPPSSGEGTTENIVTNITTRKRKTTMYMCKCEDLKDSVMDTSSLLWNALTQWLTQPDRTNRENRPRFSISHTFQLATLEGKNLFAYSISFQLPGAGDFHVVRRMFHFFALYQHLQQVYSDGFSQLPVLFPKGYSHSDEQLRCRQLEIFLNEVLELPDIWDHDCLQNFLFSGFRETNPSEVDPTKRNSSKLPSKSVEEQVGVSAPITEASSEQKTNADEQKTNADEQKTNADGQTEKTGEEPSQSSDTKNEDALETQEENNNEEFNGEQQLEDEEFLSDSDDSDEESSKQEALSTVEHYTRMKRETILLS